MPEEKGMATEEWIKLSDRYLMPTYRRYPLVLVKGKGTRVWDVSGKEYLDFGAGIAVCSLGHSHPQVVEAIKRQAENLLHVSNLYHILPQIELARLLVEHSFADRAFFCNSGAEANEAAIKLARKYARENMKGRKYEIITALGSFHGRTLITVAATGQEKIKEGFEPLPPGFRHVPYGDLKALEKAINPLTCAVMLEPIQGEAGVILPPSNYLKGVEDICKRKSLLLILDEVQTGIGRTGTLFAYEHWGLCPDIITLAKGLGGGVAIGAMLARSKVSRAFGPGTHASTFGGNPLACAVGKAVVETIMEDGFLDEVKRKGNYFLQGLKRVASNSSIVKDIRGMGLMLALEMKCPAKELMDALMREGYLVIPAGERVIRFLPPLIITKEEIDLLLKALEKLL